MGRASFPSKVLLFGEYSIIHNSYALAIPYHLFDGKLDFGRGGDWAYSQKELKSFAHYLQKLQEQQEIPIQFDLTSFFFDLQHGLYFSSSIPHGYGVGSSGAICAAVLDAYGLETEKFSDNLLGLRLLFAKMESFFHGKSSGIDPLVSYLNNPLFILSATELRRVSLPAFKGKKGAFFLLSTDSPHKTGPLVQLFLEKSSQATFWKLCQDLLIPTTNHCIQSFLDGEMKTLYSSLYTLSEFQYTHFAPMIPDNFRLIWHKGFESNSYLLKLCGAGGGGFLLGMTLDIEKTKELLAGHQLRVLFSF